MFQYGNNIKSHLWSDFPESWFLNPGCWSNQILGSETMSLDTTGKKNCCLEKNYSFLFIFSSSTFLFFILECLQHSVFFCAYTVVLAYEITRSLFNIRAYKRLPKKQTRVYVPTFGVFNFHDLFIVRMTIKTHLRVLKKNELIHEYIR